MIGFLKSKEVKTFALVAPAIAGQVWSDDRLAKAGGGPQKVGFSEVVPVALGADEVGKSEAEELQEFRQKGKVLFNSCCPAFKRLIEKNFPPLAAQISKTKSPMLVTAEMVRAAEPTAKLVFIGPCLAKKGEAKHEGNSLIDAVLTFEELTALLVAAEVNLAECQPVAGGAGGPSPTPLGMNFAQSGGVLAAVTSGEKGRRNEGDCRGWPPKLPRAVEEDCQRDGNVRFCRRNGLCEGGCVGGPGTLVNTRVAVRALRKATEKKGVA